MSSWSQFIIPKTIDEALQALASAPGPARPVAGGTDLILELQQGRPPAGQALHTLVDVSNIDELRCLEVRDGELFIGAAVLVRDITNSSLIHKHALAVSEACGLIGGPQVRNTATLGGNVAHSLPAADGTIGLVALGAQVEIASSQGRRLEPILAIFRGVGLSALALDREILVGFHIPLRRPGQASAFGRVMRPQGVALPIINLAVWLQRGGERIEAIRIAVGPAGPTPQRATVIEACLAGKPFNPETLDQAKSLVDTSLRFRTSPQRATAAYRYHLCKVLLEEIISRAWERALEVEK